MRSPRKESNSQCEAKNVNDVFSFQVAQSTKCYDHRHIMGARMLLLPLKILRVCPILLEADLRPPHSRPHSVAKTFLVASQLAFALR